MATLTCVRTAKKEGQTYEDFLASRLLGFGGSDIGDLLDSEPYGCKRRLFLGRLGLLPDNGDQSRRSHLERGKFFEAPVTELYASKTGREVKETGTGYLKQFPFVRANADRLVFTTESEGNGWGVLEIKVPAAWSFKKIKKEGLPESYILQIQWQMLCYGTSWGSFCVYWPDGHELLWFDIKRDPDLCEILLERAKEEWKLLGDVRNDIDRGNVWQHTVGFPEKKDPHYTGCQRCAAYEMCHEFAIPEGVVLQAPELEPSAARYIELTKEIKRLEDEKDREKEAIKAEFAKFPAEKLVCGRFDVALREQTRESLDSAVKKELTPEQLVRYTKRTEFQTLTVKEQKK